MSLVTHPEPFAVVASRLRADDRRILEAFEKRGVSCRLIDSRVLWCSLHESACAARTVLVREIGQVRAAYAARLLEANGSAVVNSAGAIAACGDKWLTSVALRGADLPTPRTVLALTPEAALDALEHLGYPAVLKPLTGSWGRLVSRLLDRQTAEMVLDYIAALPSPQAHVIYVQELIEKPDRDIRAIVVGGEVLGANYRICRGWRTNVARGAQTVPCALTPELVELVLGAACCVGAEIAGVDLIEDSDGRLSVLEVNQGVEFSGFEKAFGGTVSVADAVVDHLVRKGEECCA